MDVPFAHLRGFRTYAFESEGELLEVAARPGMLVAVNGEKLANANATLRRITNENLGYPDGIGAVLGLRRHGLRAARVAGSDMWLSIVRRYAGRRRFYLVGSTHSVVREAVQRLHGRFPKLEIVGWRDGYLAEGDEAKLASELREARADIVFVAMGSPRQEVLMELLIDRWPAFYMGLGGSLDILVGRRRRAPRWMQRSGLEWLYRFYENPRRLRRLPAYAKFGWLLLSGKV